LQADSNDLHKGRISLRLGKIGLDTEEPHEAEQHLSAALEAFLPGLTAHIKAAVGSVERKRWVCRRLPRRLAGWAD
jgi:hypothetical protein